MKAQGVILILFRHVSHKRIHRVEEVLEGRMREERLLVTVVHHQLHLAKVLRRCLQVHEEIVIPSGGAVRFPLSKEL